MDNDFEKNKMPEIRTNKNVFKLKLGCEYDDYVNSFNTFIRK
jgi:hypothetical protein